MTSAGVLCAGSVIVDLNKTVESYPAPEMLTTIEAVATSTGGPGLNLAVDLKLLGARFPIGLVAAVGDDLHGDYLLSECDRLGIEVAGHLGNVRRLPGTATSFTDAMVERDGGRRTFFHHPGANALLDAGALAGDVFLRNSGARILHAGAPGLHALMDSPLDPERPEAGNGWSALLERAQAAGLHTNLELVSVAPERILATARPCLPHLDSLVANEVEAGALTGLDAKVDGPDGAVDWPVLEEIALGLVEAGVSRLAVVHFPAGCVAAAPGGRTWRQGSVLVPRAEVRGTTGAGDAFAAGVLLALHDDLEVEDCLRLGVAAAAAAIRSVGTSDGVLPADQCLAAADRAGYRPTG